MFISGAMSFGTPKTINGSIPKSVHLFDKLCRPRNPLMYAEKYSYHAGLLIGLSGFMIFPISPFGKCIDRDVEMSEMLFHPQPLPSFVSHSFPRLRLGNEKEDSKLEQYPNAYYIQENVYVGIRMSIVQWSLWSCIRIKHILYAISKRRVPSHICNLKKKNMPETIQN